MLTAHPTPPLLCIGANPQAGLGDTFTDVTTILSKAQGYLPLILDIVTDPALPEVAKKIRVIQGLAVKPTAAKPPATTSPSSTPKPLGIGLKRFLPAMDAAIWYLRYPWAPWVIGGGVVVALAGGGYALGRWSGKRAARKAAPASAGFGRRPRRRRYRGTLG